MAFYKVTWKRSAARELEKLPKDVISRIVDAVEQLASDPYPRGANRLVGADKTYRIREGSYRILYTVMGKDLIIEIVKVGHRKDVYSR
jgi:mRNA interferase RelE/StbE